jgi:hypothetical protein
MEQMSLDERLKIGCEAAEYYNRGDKEGYARTMAKIPMPPYMAKIIKDYFGADTLKKMNWNMSEVEEEYGPDWINK